MANYEINKIQINPINLMRCCFAKPKSWGTLGTRAPGSVGRRAVWGAGQRGALGSVGWQAARALSAWPLCGAFSTLTCSEKDLEMAAWWRGRSG